MNVASHILSITILILISASFFFSTTYVFIFIFKPHNREATDEQQALLETPKLPATKSAGVSQEAPFSFYFQMAAFALVYSAIQAGWFNSNKVLMQLSWKSDINDELQEVS